MTGLDGVETREMVAATGIEPVTKGL